MSNGVPWILTTQQVYLLVLRDIPRGQALMNNDEQSTNQPTWQFTWGPHDKIEGLVTVNMSPGTPRHLVGKTVPLYILQSPMPAQATEGFPVIAAVFCPQC